MTCSASRIINDMRNDAVASRHLMQQGEEGYREACQSLQSNEVNMETVQQDLMYDAIARIKFGMTVEEARREGICIKCRWMVASKEQILPSVRTAWSMRAQF